jgi:hypothetical protein
MLELDSNKLLTITATVNGVPILACDLRGENIANELATHESLDDWMAAKGWSLATAQEAAIEILKGKDMTAIQRLVPTLLWLACRGEDGKTREEGMRHGGVTVALAFQDLADDRPTLQCMLLPPRDEQTGPAC